MAEQVLPVCSSAAFTDTPASLGGAETGGRSLGGGGGTGGHEKGQGRVRVERRGVVERSTLGLRLQRGERTVSQHVEEKGKHSCEDHQVSFVTFLTARVCRVTAVTLSLLRLFFLSPPTTQGADLKSACRHVLIPLVLP